VAATIVTPKWGEGVKENGQNLSERISHPRNPVDSSTQLDAEALRKCVDSLEQVIGTLNAITMQAPRGGQWDQVRADVGYLDSIGDVTRQTLDVLQGRRSDSPSE